MSKTNTMAAHLAVTKQEHDIMKAQKAFSELAIKTNAFTCTICDIKPFLLKDNVYRNIMKLDDSLNQLVHFIRNILVEWPIECGCFLRVRPHIQMAYTMLTTLYTRYPFAFSNFEMFVPPFPSANLTDIEREQLNFFETIDKNIQKLIKSIRVDALTGCIKEHRFICHHYKYERCDRCHYRHDKCKNH